MCALHAQQNLSSKELLAITSGQYLGFLYLSLERPFLLKGTLGFLGYFGCL
jgi:hypothetical protein